jgi:hypothetical protein
MGAFAVGFSGAVGGLARLHAVGGEKLPKSARRLDVGMVLALALCGALLGRGLVGQKN